MEPKPDHLAPRYAAQFRDGSVARAYSTRPPYPPELFDRLEALMPEGRRVVLDLGCGTGEVAIGLAQRVDRIDAVDPSEAMLAAACARPGADEPAIRWIHASAEEAELGGPYSLVVAAESFHWMDWNVVPARIAAALRPDGHLALVVGREIIDAPWADELAQLIPRYSTNRDFQPYDLVSELDRRGVFMETGRHTTRPVPFEQTLDDYVESFHTRNGFSRERMTPAQADAFDAAVRAMVASHVPDRTVRGDVRAEIVWGRPSPPRAAVGE